MSNKKAYTILFFSFILHFLLSLLILKNYLNNNPSFQYIGYSATDLEFYSRGMIIAYENNLTKALANAIRLPVYPIIISFFIKIFDQPILAIKLFQVLLNSFIIVIAFFTIKNFIKDNKLSLFGIIPFFFWIPFYYFSPILIVESISIFFVAVFVFLISKISQKNYKKISFLIGIIIGILSLLKSNNLVLFLPFFVYLYFILNKKILLTIRSFLITFIIFIIIVLPWSIFVSLHNKMFIPFSVLGPNAIIYGMGQKVPPKNRNLMKEVIKKYNIYDEDISERVYKNVHLVLNTNKYLDILMQLIHKGINPYEDKNNPLSKKYFSLQNIEIGGKNIKIGNNNLMSIIKNEWKNKTFPYIVLGFAKILHGIGCSFRNKIDYIIFITFIISIIGVLVLYKTFLKKFIIFYLSMIFVYFFQAFLVYGDHKYRVVLFDFSMILTISFLFIYIINKIYYKSAKI